MALKLLVRADHLLNPSPLLGVQEPCEGVLVCGVNFPFDLFAGCAKHEVGCRSARAGVRREPLGTATATLN